MSGTYVVVLGGGHREDLAGLNDRTLERLGTAVELFFSEGAQGLVCSGAYALALDTAPTRSEASLMAEHARLRGVPDAAIIREERSLDTIGNIAVTGFEVLPSLEPSRVYIVTSGYHMRRVRYLVRRMWGTRYTTEFRHARAGLSSWARAQTVLTELNLLVMTRRMLRGISTGDGKAFLAARPLLPRG